MIRICMFCDRVFGEKEPLYDKRATHGICDPCFDEFTVKYETQETVKKRTRNWPTMQAKLVNSITTPSGG